MNKASTTRRRYDTGITNTKLFGLRKPKSFAILELKSFVKYYVIKSKVAFIVLLFLISTSVSICHAVTINYPFDYSSLQAAINAANPGDTVLISIGTFSELNEITLKDGVNIKGAGAIRSDSKITCSIKGASNCAIENLTLEAPDSADYILTIPPTSRNMKFRACYVYAYKPILIEGSGITLENNIINGDQSRFNQSLSLSLILLRNNPETNIYPNLIKNNTLSIKVENETPPDGYLLHLLNSGNTKIANNILDAIYDSPEGLKVLTTGKPLLIEGASTPSIEYNAYVGYIEEASLGKGNVAASALSDRPLPNTTTLLLDASIAKEAGLTTITEEGQPAESHTTEIGAFGDPADYAPPLISNIFPYTGYSTTSGLVPFKATLQDNAALKTFRILCINHPGEAITGDIYLGGVDTGLDYTLNGGYVNLPTQNLTQTNFEFRPKVNFSNADHKYWLGVFDASGNWAMCQAPFKVYSGGGGGGGGCFLAGTPILMADGTTKPIEDIKVRDKILAYDEDTNSFKPDKVKRCFMFPEEPGYLIINGHIKVTPHHRFMIKDKWIEAGSLKVGDKMLTKDGKSEIIISIEKINEKVTVYNLEVNPYHTFIADGVVVHNAALVGGTARAVAAPGPIAK